MDDFEAAAASRLQVNRNDLRALNLLESGPVSQVVTARALHVTRPSVTAGVDRLEEAGLVRRLPDRGDRRSTLVKLLPATWAAFAAGYPPAGERVSEVASGWSGRQQRLVVGALRELAEIFKPGNASPAKDSDPAQPQGLP